uniref:Uncharacterized protein n=1 Tax=Globisporangium ultimum (strain ATCC 200006 / CBS 805.95 / DAOM BR144) TaxID=431595 RepID=K3WCM9_GLOUD
MFMIPSLRTSQALYYTPEVLSQPGFHLCFTQHSIRPIFCDADWVNVKYSCPHDNAACQNVGHVGNHILCRVHALQTRFADMGDSQVDLTVLSSHCG